MIRIINFIKGLNHILFFVGALFLIALLAKELFPKNTYNPSKVQVLDSSQSDKKSQKVSYEVQYYTKLKDTYVFRLSAEFVDKAKKHSTISDIKFNPSYSRFDNENVVNLMFVKEGGSKKMLFEKDALILSISEIKESINEKIFDLDKNVYLAVSDDSNNDGHLNAHDSASLFISSYDGTNLTKVMSDVTSYFIVEDNRLLVAKSGNENSYYLYDVSSGSLTELNTEITLTKRTITPPQAVAGRS